MLAWHAHWQFVCLHLPDCIPALTVLLLCCCCLTAVAAALLPRPFVPQVRDNALVVSAEYVRIIITCDKVGAAAAHVAISWIH
jgi:hypothetical protein